MPTTSGQFRLLHHHFVEHGKQHYQGDAHNYAQRLIPIAIAHQFPIQYFRSGTMLCALFPVWLHLSSSLPKRGSHSRPVPGPTREIEPEIVGADFPPFAAAAVTDLDTATTHPTFTYREIMGPDYDDGFARL